MIFFCIFRFFQTSILILCQKTVAGLDLKSLKLVQSKGNSPPHVSFTLRIMMLLLDFIRDTQTAHPPISLISICRALYNDVLFMTRADCRIVWDLFFYQ